MDRFFTSAFLILFQDTLEILGLSFLIFAKNVSNELMK